MAYTQNQIEQIIILRQKGYSLDKISEELNMARKTVTKYLKLNGYSTERNPIKKDIFNTIDTEEKAYWLGFLYADGCVSNIQGQVTLGLQAQDIVHLEKFKKFLQCNNKISYSESTNSYRLSFCCSEITNALKKLGCIPRKSLILKFPTEEQVPSYLKRHFMRGYVDGDGCLCFTDKTYVFSFVGTEEFILEAIKFFNWKECKLDTTGNAKIWRCGNKKLVPDYLKTLYENSSIYLDRKYEKFKKMIQP